MAREKGEAHKTPRKFRTRRRFLSGRNQWKRDSIWGSKRLGKRLKRNRRAKPKKRDDFGGRNHKAGEVSFHTGNSGKGGLEGSSYGKKRHWNGLRMLFRRKTVPLRGRGKS